MSRYFQEELETMDRDDLDALIDERIRYTVKYAHERSPFYRHWFREHGIEPDDIAAHEDLLNLPVISARTIRNHQPPVTRDFDFMSTEWKDVHTIHETSGTSGTPKTFFLTWEDWQRYAEKYARIFVSQGFEKGDRVAICASYGMNVGASTMTLAARDLGITIIPEGKCTFPVRVMQNYRPTAIVGSVFKLLHLARKMESEGIPPTESSVARLVVGGESFAGEARLFLGEVWGCEVYNTYGSTEGTMCGECTEIAGLHVPEDLVHLDLYNPDSKQFVRDGDEGRMVLTTLIPAGGKAGTLLLNYDTEDTTRVVHRDRCACGRTHMRIAHPRRETETVYIAGIPFNRVDVESAVFQRENMEYITGEYEAFVYEGADERETILRVSLECSDAGRCGKKEVEENFLTTLFTRLPEIGAMHEDGTLSVLMHYVDPGGLELHRVKGRPKRLVDRR